jgi:hypothetical protein
VAGRTEFLQVHHDEKRRKENVVQPETSIHLRFDSNQLRIGVLETSIHLRISVLETSIHLRIDHEMIAPTINNQQCDSIDSMKLISDTTTL